MSQELIGDEPIVNSNQHQVNDSGLQEERSVVYSLIIPVYNEEDSLRPLLDEILQAMNTTAEPFEIIFVNDCSSDSSGEIFAAFELEYPNIVRVVNLTERSGQTLALRKGLDIVDGDIAITLDADLQNDPADIPKMIRMIREGYDVVCGWRRARQDKPLKAFLSKLGNVLQRLLTGMHIHDVSCTLRAYRKHCVDKIPLNWEGQHRFIPLSLSLQGYKVGEILSNHRQRRFGTTKYTHKRIFKVVLDFFRILIVRGKR